MTHKMRGISCVVVCLLAGLVSTATGKSHDVSPGMSIPHALIVVKRCVVEATSFNEERTISNLQLRAQDTLEFVGITDDARLNSLRRFLVRNIDLGVQSIWGKRLNNGYSSPYLIPNSALAGIKKDWTLEQLAREVIKEAGLPFMTHAKAAQIVANCRGVAKPAPANAKTQTKPIKLSTKIWDDLTSPAERAGLENCILGNQEKGIETAGVIDAEGDFFPYLATSVSDEVKQLLKVDTKKYVDLVGLLHDEARVALPADLTARILVYNSLLQRKGGLLGISFPITDICGNVQCRKLELGAFDLQALSAMGITDNSITPSKAGVEWYRKGEKTAVLPVPDPLKTISIAQGTTLRDLRKEIETQLK